MYARVTQLEIDTVRTNIRDAVELFRSEVLPVLREQAGYQGVDVLATAEGQAMLVSFWDTAEHAQADAERGFYADVLAKYVTLFRAPPGRDRYEVRLVDRADAPSAL
jgi:hypothetical protein